MNHDLLITRLPTLVNTEGMGIKELREQYKLLEGEAIVQAQQKPLSKHSNCPNSKPHCTASTRSRMNTAPTLPPCVIATTRATKPRSC